MAPDAVEQSPPPSSLVVLELGTRSVSAVLCGVVAGHYRLVSSAEAWHRSSDADVLDAVGRAFRGLEAASERRLLGTHGVVVPMTRDGVGCDLTIVSGGSPLRALVLSFGKAATSFLDGIDPAVADLLPLFAVEDAIEERLGLTGEILSSLREHRPDALILVGSEEAGSFQSTPALAGALTTVHACHPGGLPTVLLAGPAAVRERLVADLRQRVRRGPDSVPPVQQTEPGDLSDHLKRLWQEKWASHPAWRAFAGGGDSPPIPRLTSIGRTCQELSRIRESPVWAIEVGDSDVVAWRATPERVDLVRRSIGQLAPQRNDGELDEWLSRPWLAEVDRASIERQRDLTSRAIGEVAGELRGLGRSEPRPGLVVGRGVGLVHRLPAADAVIAICLGIGLTGPTPVALDRHGLLAGAGLLLERHRDAGVDLIRDALDELGVAIIGRSVESDGARVQIEGTSKDGKAPSDVRVGEVSVLSSLEWTNSEIALNPSRTVDVGYGEGRHGQISLGESEVGAVLTISTERAPRRWARVQGGATGLAALLRRST